MCSGVLNRILKHNGSSLSAWLIGSRHAGEVRLLSTVAAYARDSGKKETVSLKTDAGGSLIEIAVEHGICSAFQCNLLKLVTHILLTTACLLQSRSAACSQLELRLLASARLPAQDRAPRLALSSSQRRSKPRNFRYCGHCSMQPYQTRQERFG